MSAYLVPKNEGRQTPNNLDLIRIAMAILVVWSHSFAIYFGSENREPLTFLTLGAIRSGELGVHVFFMISGFLITQSFDRSSSLSSFFKKRIARIYPGYLVAVAICAFIIIPAYSPITYTVQSIVKTIGLNLLLQGWFVTQPFSGGAVNGSLWSIPFEFWCYIGVAVLGVSGLARRKELLLLAFVCILMGHAAVLITGKIFGGGILATIFGWPNFWFRMLPCFMAGMLIYQYRDSLPRQLGLVVAGLLLVLIVTRLPLEAPWRFGLAALVYPAAFAYAVFYFAFSPQLFNAAKYGDFSYGTYLYAFPIQQMIRTTFGAEIPFWLYVPLTICLSVSAGIASWYCVERWFLTRKSARHEVIEAEPISQLDQ
jgi:peptidoglycan/LPS O-acetylase OafA/YrhL